MVFVSIIVNILKKAKSDVHEMLHARQLNWAKLSTGLKNGRIIMKSLASNDIICNDAPIFTQDRHIFDLLIPKYG